jgi:hypothetical protein
MAEASLKYAVFLECLLPPLFQDFRRVAIAARMGKMVRIPILHVKKFILALFPTDTTTRSSIQINTTEAKCRTILTMAI